jgi:hypothetical protein
MSELDRMLREREELLTSGMYSEDDMLIMELNNQISELRMK